ncbi:uncharacterized protein [Onthophagus taurus]|uniref:uncharacterized protein n=1 Tax=Onthophagus taurus TaxID=166361 RepID=UPI0039BEB629
MDEKPKASDGPAGQVESRATRGEGSTTRDYVDHFIQGSASRSEEEHVFRRSSLIGRSPTKSAKHEAESTDARRDTKGEETSSEESRESDDDLDQTFISAEGYEMPTEEKGGVIDLIGPEKTKQYSQLTFSPLADLEDDTPPRVRSWSFGSGAARQASIEEIMTRESKKRKIIQRGSEEEKEGMKGEVRREEEEVKMPTKKTMRERNKESLGYKERGGEQTTADTRRKQAKELQKTARGITELIKVLRKNVEQNTKREIKEAVVELERMGEVLERVEIKELIKEIGNSGQPHEDGKSSQTNLPSRTKEIATQTIDEKVLQIIRTEDYNVWKEMNDKEWEEDLYTNTEIRVGNPIKSPDNIVKVVVLEPEDAQMERGMQKAYRERYPELLQISDDFGFVEQNYKVGSRGRMEEGRRKIVKFGYDGTEEDMFRKLVMCKTEVENDKEVAIHLINKVSLEVYRKMIESIFHSSETKVYIYTTAITGKADTATRIRKSYALIVEKGDRSFKESVKQIRQALGGKDIKNAIKSVRSTKDGKVLITTDRNESIIKKAQEAIRTMPGEKAQVRIVGEEKETLHIRGMDASTDNMEIVEAIETTLGEPNIDLYTSELRPMKSNTQAVTVTLDKKKADILLKTGRIKIGLTRCRIEKRIKLERCFRCWDYGHTARDCKGIDRSKFCFKCGNDDHEQQACKNKEACPLCESEGHRAGTGKCKVFITALSSARKEEQRKSNGE